MSFYKYYTAEFWKKTQPCSLVGYTGLIPEEKLVKKWGQ